MMKTFRKLTLILLSVAILTGCAAQKTAEVTVTSAPDTDLHVLATCYPVYALTSMITDGIEDVKVTCMTQPRDGCIRTYTLSDWDASLAANADVIVTGGNGLESYADAFYSMGESGPIVITAIYDQELRKDTCANSADADTSHWSESNPHVYMSLDGAAGMLQSIETGLAVVDPAHEETYLANLNAANDRIGELRSVSGALKEKLAGTKVIVMSEALVYTAAEIGFDIEACWARESGETVYDQSLDYWVEQLTAFESRVILIEQQAPEMLTRTLKNAGFTVIKLNNMSTIPASAGADGWFTAFDNNLKLISELINS